MNGIEITHLGVHLRGQIVLPDAAGPHPAVLVMHSALGLKQHELGIADRLAKAGYVALAADMFGSAFDGDPSKAGAFFADLVADPQVLVDRANLWLTALAQHEAVDAHRIAAIGYCFGGQCVLEMVRSGADLRAAVSFHGLLSTRNPAKAGAVKGEVVAWCGSEDPYAPLDQIETFRTEMADAGARCQITIFGGVGHGFTDPAVDALARPGIAYDEVAQRVSWGGTMALLDGLLHPATGNAA